MPVKAASAGSLQSKPSLAARSIRAVLAIASMGAFAYVFAYAYIEGTANGSSRVVPLLRADASPIKTRPTEPGGLRVPDRDKKIYERNPGSPPLSTRCGPRAGTSPDCASSSRRTGR